MVALPPSLVSTDFIIIIIIIITIFNWNVLLQITRTNEQYSLL